MSSTVWQAKKDHNPAEAHAAASCRTNSSSLLGLFAVPLGTSLGASELGGTKENSLSLSLSACLLGEHQNPGDSLAVARTNRAFR